MKYKDLKLKKDTSTTTIDIEDSLVKGVKVKNYIPIEDKISIVYSAVVKGWDSGSGVLYKPEIEIALNIGIIEKGTDITFTKADKKDLYKLYDELESNGCIDDIMDFINPTDKEEIFGYAEDLSDQILNNQKSILSGAYNSISQQEITGELLSTWIEKQSSK